MSEMNAQLTLPCMSQGFFLFKGPVNLYIQGKYYTRTRFQRASEKITGIAAFFHSPLPRRENKFLILVHVQRQGYSDRYLKRSSLTIFSGTDKAAFSSLFPFSLRGFF